MDENYNRNFNEGKERVCSTGSSSSSSVMSDCPAGSNGVSGAKTKAVVKQEPDLGLALTQPTPGPDDVSDYAQNTMNELLAIYGYEGVDKSVTRQLHLINFSQKQGDTEDVTRVQHPSEGDCNSQDSVHMRSGSPRLSSNGSAEHQPISLQSQVPSDVLNSDPNDRILCDWCKSYGPKCFTLSTSTKTKAFCSERCFASCRRVYLKKICNWCKHSRHNTEYVTYRHGSQTLQFCSGKCLSQFRKNEGNMIDSDSDYRDGERGETMRKRSLLDPRGSVDALPHEPITHDVTQSSDGRAVLVNPTYKNQPLNLTSPLPGTQFNLLPTTQLMPGQMFSPFQTINSPFFQFPTFMQPHQMLLQRQQPLLVNQNPCARASRTTVDQERSKCREQEDTSPDNYHASESIARTSRSRTNSTNGHKPETSSTPPETPSTQPCSLLPPTTILVPHPVFVPIPVPIPIPIPVPADKFPKSYQQAFNNQRSEEEPLPKKVTREHVFRQEQEYVEQSDPHLSERSSPVAAHFNVREKRKLLPKLQSSPSYVPVHPSYVTMSSHQPPAERASPAEPISIHRPQFVMLNRPPPNKLPIPRMPRKPHMKDRDDVVLRISDKYPRQLSASTSQLNGIEKIGNAESSSKVREALRCHLTRRLSQSAVNLVEATKLKFTTTADELRRSLSLGRLNEDQDNKLGSKVSHSLGNLHDSRGAGGSGGGATVTDEQIRQDAAHTAIRPDNLKRPLDYDVYRIMDLKLKRKRFLADMDS